MSIIYPIHKAPYTNYHDLNLDWIIDTLNDFNDRLSNFVSLATIKYADPIQWDITNQYEANTVVVDSAGNAYLSVQPVPSGVSLDRTEYWTKIGNFDELFANVKKAITPNDEGHSTTATAARAVDDLVWVNGALVRVTRAMIAGDAYVPGSNCVTSSTNEVFHYLLTALNAEQQAREDADTQLDQKITNEQTAREQADTGLGDRITAEQTAREQADTQLKQEIDDEIAASSKLVTAADNVTTVHGDTINLASTVKTFVGSAVTWLENIHRKFSETIASFVSKSDSGNYGAVFASRNSDNNADEAMSAIGIGGFGISDNTSKPKPAWGGYFEGRKIGQSGPAFGLEIDTGAWGNEPLEVTPYSAINAYTGQNAIVAGINLSAGLGYADGNSPYQLTPYGSSAALWIHANPKKFKQGIVFQDGAVDDSCIIMPWTGRISWSREDVFNSPNVAYLTATGHCLSDWSDTNFPFLAFNRQTANGGPIPDDSIIGQVGAGGRLYNLPCRIDFKKVSGNKYQLIFYTGENSITFYDNFIFPQNATISIGTANNRFATAYLVSDVNVSSDERLKQDVSEIPENLKSALRALKPKQYKLEDGKTHFGYVAQDVVEAIDSAGYDPLKTGIVDKDDKGYLSLRYTELLCAMM